MKNLLLLSALLLSGFLSAQSTETLFIEAERQYAHEAYAAAIAGYDKVIQADPAMTAAYNNRGNSYLELGDYSKAMADYDFILKLEPANAVAYRNKGLVLNALQKYTEALAAYDKAIALDPKFYNAYANKITVFMLLKQDDNAKKTADLLKSKYPDTPESYAVSATYYRLKNDYYMVFHEMETALSKDPKNLGILYERARLKDDLGDNDGAVADFTTLIKLDAGDARYFSGRASAYHDLKQYDKAVSDCNQAVALDAYNYSGYTLRAFTEDAQGFTDKAIADYERAIAVRPSEEFAYFELSTLYDWEKKYDKGLEVIERYLKVNPDSYIGLLKQADFTGKTKNYKAAILLWDKLIKIKPDFAGLSQKAMCEQADGDLHAACIDMKAANSLAKERDSDEYAQSHKFLFEKCRDFYTPKKLKAYDLYQELLALYDKNDMQGVLKKYDEMISVVPDSAYLYVDRGQHKRLLLDYEGAIKDYRKALALDKNIGKARNVLAIALTLQGKNDEAINVYLETIKSYAPSAMDFFNLGIIYANKEEYTKAIGYLEKAIEKDSLYTNAYLNLGLVYIKTGDKAKACYYLKAAERMGSMEARVKRISECE